MSRYYICASPSFNLVFVPGGSADVRLILPMRQAKGALVVQALVETVEGR